MVLIVVVVVVVVVVREREGREKGFHRYFAVHQIKYPMMLSMLVNRDLMG